MAFLARPSSGAGGLESQQIRHSLARAHARARHQKFVTSLSVRPVTFLSCAHTRKNVTTSLARVKSVPEAEQEEEDQILQKTKERRGFYKEYGKAMLRTESHDLAKRWQGPDCILNVTTHGSEFLALRMSDSR